VSLEDEPDHNVRKAAPKVSVAPLEEGGVLRLAAYVKFLSALLIEHRPSRQCGRLAVFPREDRDIVDPETVREFDAGDPEQFALVAYRPETEQPHARPFGAVSEPNR